VWVCFLFVWWISSLLTHEHRSFIVLWHEREREREREKREIHVLVLWHERGRDENYQTSMNWCLGSSSSSAVSTDQNLTRARPPSRFSGPPQEPPAFSYPQSTKHAQSVSTTKYLDESDYANFDPTPPSYQKAGHYGGHQAPSVKISGFGGSKSPGMAIGNMPDGKKQKTHAKATSNHLNNVRQKFTSSFVKSSSSLGGSWSGMLSISLPYLQPFFPVLAALMFTNMGCVISTAKGTASCFQMRMVPVIVPATKDCEFEFEKWNSWARVRLIETIR